MKKDILSCFMFISLATVCCIGAEKDNGESKAELTAQVFDRNIEYYEQKLEIAMTDNESASKAKLSILPLYNGKKWGVTCRWDDNNSACNAKLSALMKKHGIKGTFYLNGSGIFSGRTQDLNSKVDEKTEKGKESLKNLITDVLADGNSIGCHGWTHGLCGLMNRNRVFEEFMRNRIQLEYISDTPVNTHGFAYEAYGNIFEPTLSTKMVGTSQYRAGLYGIAILFETHRWPLLMPSPWSVTSDGVKPEKAKENIDKLLADAKAFEEDPCMQFTVHPGGHQNAEIEGAIFDLVSGKPEYWFCTQNEYAAYRTQFRLAKITSSVEGKILKVLISRPTMECLDNQIPISIAVNGIESSKIQSIKSDGTAIEKLTAGSDAFFNLPHSSLQKLPSKIDWIANEENETALSAKFAAKKFAGLSGILWKDGENLKWILKNGTNEDMSDIHAVCRLPVAYKDAGKTVKFDSLSKNSEMTQTVPLELASDNPKDRYGIGFFAIEINFTLDKQRQRLYLTTSVKDMVKLDDSYPNNNFTRIGPIPFNQYLPQMTEDIISGKKNEVVLKDGKVLKPMKIELTPEQQSQHYDMDPETVFATGAAYMSRWKGDQNPNDGVWIYRSTVISQKQEQAIFWPTATQAVPGNTCFNRKTIYINGKKLPGYDSFFTLNAGKNDLIIAYETAPASLSILSIENIAFFCRIASRPQGKNPPWNGLEPRIKTIKYTIPE